MAKCHDRIKRLFILLIAVKIERMFNDLSIFKNENVLAGFTTRCVPGHQRREELAQKAARHANVAVRLGLVHGNAIVHVTAQDFMCAQNGILDYDNVDGAVTDVRETVLTTGHADCLPVYLYDPIKNAIGLAHAGWKGTLVNIAGALVENMVHRFNSDPKDIKAFIGPGIGFCCFEVGREVVEAFQCSYDWTLTDVLKKENGQYNIDLKNINKTQLQMCGLRDIKVSSLCTKCREDLFFSYRRNKEKGRMLAYIYLKGESK